MQEAKSQAVATSKAETTTLIGTIQTSGITEHMKGKYNLVNSEYQILSDSVFYFLEGSQDFESYWGKCVGIIGTIKMEKSTERNNYSFDRGAFSVQKISTLNFDSCQFAIGETKEELAQYMLKHYGPSLEQTTMTGFIDRAKRISPDIGGDYILELDEPYVNNSYVDDLGNPAVMHSIVIGYLNFEMLKIFEQRILDGKKVRLTGYKIGGYLHSSVLRVTSINSD